MNKSKEKLKAVREKLLSLTEDERKQLTAYGIVNIEGSRLSDHNTMLIALQNPQSTIVGGFQQWRKAGRSVRKGESGMVIWFPSKKKDENEEDTPQFFTGTVFDLTQTEEAVKEEVPC